MRKAILLIIAILLVSCRPHKLSGPTGSGLDNLRIKKDIYCELSRKNLQEKTYLGDKCDSLLFTSLYAAVCGEVDLSSWEDPSVPGKMYRNPERDCYPDESKSSISRDMLLGYMTYLWKQRDLTNAAEMISYGKSVTWVMGEYNDAEGLSRVLMTPQLISLLTDIESKLSTGAALRLVGEDDAVLINTGFRAHLDVLRIVLSGSVRSGISEIERLILKGQSERVRENALFQAAYARYNGGDQTNAVLLLMDENRFPVGKLPDNHTNQCEGYVYQRDPGEDWAPCPDRELHQHDGVDFLVAASIALGDL